MKDIPREGRRSGEGEREEGKGVEPGRECLFLTPQTGHPESRRAEPDLDTAISQWPPLGPDTQ